MRSFKKKKKKGHFHSQASLQNTAQTPKGCKETSREPVGEKTTVPFEKETQRGTLKELKLLVQQGKTPQEEKDPPTQGQAQPGSQQPVPDRAANTADSPVSKTLNGSLSSLLYQMRREGTRASSTAVVIGKLENVVWKTEPQ